ncbi:type II toxin-antitoxin system VapC family toxin [Candidatus Peregrinibacteria bacterium]|nr:MAG: type II toxin-antitoxin system VapC family toxin [Candidatus Peregrinibacteria bacterium]
MKADDTKKLILDTSVLLKWLINEPEDLEQANHLRALFLKGEVDIKILALTVWEVNNQLGRIYDPNAAAGLFSHFQMYKIPQAILKTSDCLMAFHIMKKCPGVSFYDASYHAVALQESAGFLTADKKYYDKAKKLGHILLLKDYH